MSKLIDLSGKNFGMWQVLSKIKNAKRTKWLCRCKCGQEKEIWGVHLVRGKSRSCGCKSISHGKNSVHWKGTNIVSGTTYGNIRRNAKNRNIEFKVSIEYISNLLVQQNFRCAISGVKINLPTQRLQQRFWKYTASLDRINPKKGYIEGNVQWVHKWINVMKWDLTHDQFISWCLLVFNHNKDFLKQRKSNKNMQ